MISGEFPSQNEIVKALNSRNRNVYNSMKQRETDRVAWSCKGGPQLKKVIAQFLWITKDKMKDPDNVTAGQKFIFDGLVKGGILKNDGRNQIARITHDFGVDKADPRVVVRLISIK